MRSLDARGTQNDGNYLALKFTWLPGLGSCESPRR